MSELARRAAAPRLARPAAAVPAPVPPLARPSVPETSEPSATNEGVQFTPSNRKCWLAAGTDEATLAPRILATIVAFCVPVTSPPSVPEKLVEVTVRFVRPAPLPVNEPTKLFPAFRNHLPPFIVFPPPKV